jgi:hypothetical protein
VNSGPPNFIAIGIGMFLLAPTPVYQAVTGTSPICAEYIGPYVAGSMHAGAGAAAHTGNTGGYVVRLVQ